MTHLCLLDHTLTLHTLKPLVSQPCLYFLVFQSPSRPSVSEECRSLTFRFSLHRHSYKYSLHLSLYIFIINTLLHYRHTRISFIVKTRKDETCRKDPVPDPIVFLSVVVNTSPRVRWLSVIDFLTYSSWDLYFVSHFTGELTEESDQCRVSYTLSVCLTLRELCFWF